MKILKNLVINIVICSILLFAFNHFGIGIRIDFSNENSLVGLIGIFLILGLIFRIFNSPIKRILKTLSFPVNFITLGLVSVVINVLVFYLFALVANSFFDGEVTVRLGEIRQTLILSFIMALGIAILKKIL